MLALTLTLILSQTPPAIPAEVFQRFEVERPLVLEALATTYACQKPRRKPEPLCDVALSQQRGTAADVRGRNALVGLTWIVKRGKAGKVVVSEPWISSLALNEDGTRVLGALSRIDPENAEEAKTLTQLAKDYEAFFKGRKANVTPPDSIRAGLAIWSKSANHPMEKKDNAWVFKGAPGALRKVGERWVMVGMPKAGEGLVVSVFTP
ncbi:hypothetical protein F0U60_50660 [Archangium minus]|uniref:Lipoprotein n=1 Tax=Archangium minus TaxID=83450 RepID=A0ABY9X7U8_9BACT|nr:hypothetical protein F0U60_50660 [Archangium minus]